MADNTKDGKPLYLEFAGVQINGKFREFDPGLTEVNTDATGGDDALTSTHKLRDTVNPTLRILVQNTTEGNATVAALLHGASGNLIWGPDGNSAGNPKWGIVARVNANTPFKMDQERILEVTFQNEGDDWLFNGNTDTF